MYKSHSIWDEEQEKDDFIIGKDKKSPDYHHQADYASKGEAQSDVYNSQKAAIEEKKEATGIEKEVEKQEKKYQKKEEASEEQMKIKAASEVHEGSSAKTDSKDEKKVHKSIEDAINKAMKEEKEVIHIKD